MAARIQALVTPALLEWARRSAGFPVEIAAERLDVPADRLQAWEAGSESLSVGQLKKVAALYKRPLALFYLPFPPKDFTPMKDFRRLPEASSSLSADVLFEVRRATQRRQVALELAATLDETPAGFPVRATIDDDATDVAGRLRDALGISVPEREKWSDEYEALRHWRSAAERLGVLVFRAQRLDPREARGFSLGEDVFPVVVFSSKDAPAGRVFTLLHELAHVALRNGGLCDLHDTKSAETANDRVEVFCNAVAAEVLVPAAVLVGTTDVRFHRSGAPWSDDELRDLARRFGVSREVVLRRLVTLGKAAPSQYQSKRAEWLAKAKPKSGGFETQDEKALREHGRLYTRLILTSLHEKTISIGDASDFLSVKTKHLDAIERALDMARSAEA